MHFKYDILKTLPSINIISDNFFIRKKVTLSILRLDKIHEVVSGNKLFKLHYFLSEAISTGYKMIITVGGAYSNHLAATAYACKGQGLQCIGVVRGEKPVNLSHTLLFCMQHGMQLKFISRSDYKKIASAEFQHTLEEEFGNHIFVPEGGFSPQGVKGAKNITVFFNEENYTHICCAVGTATTVAGLLQGSGKTSEIIGFSVLKNMTDINQRLQQLKVDNAKNFIFNGNYHFGGYAKKTNELIAFMNTFYHDNKIPLDFVYTGKMMFGIYDLIKKDYFSPGSNILCIHTGGLQGNKSLPHGMLNF